MSSAPAAGLDAHLACPQCGAASLRSLQRLFACEACGTRYPQLADVPWLFAEPDYRITEWRQRFTLLLREYEQQCAALRAEAGADGLRPAARARLESQVRAMQAHRAALERVLAPLTGSSAGSRRETLLALRTRVPMAQDLTSYYVNLHRDWSWGDAENAAALEIVAALFAGHAPDTLLVAGSGGGRLAYDLHQALAPRRTVALDLNPLLQFVASAVCRGEAVTLWEFPIAPRTAAEQGIERELRAPAVARPGLHFVLGDALRSPLRAGSFDALLTPWFIDIVPQPFAEVAVRMNRLLRAGGAWINFGSLAFAQGAAADCLSSDEVLQILRESGFEVDAVREDRIPYMRSPASRHAREELTWSFRAVKRAEAADPGPAWNLPDWLADGAQPVPRLPHFETQGLVTRIYAFVLALIDGRRGTREIAAYLVEQKLMEPADAEAAVRSFLTQMFEESRRRTRF